MGLFGSKSQGSTVNEELVTLYRGESIHPQLAKAFDWFDEDVKPFMNQDDIIIAGGAMRSHFTGTPVRDYDLYVPKKYLGQLGGATTDLFKNLSGGYWKKSVESDMSWVYRCIEYDPFNQRMTDRAFNVCKKPFESPQDVIDTYDFTVCMCAMTQDSITHHPDYFTDLATKTIRIHDLHDPMALLWRLQKYNRYGFQIDKTELWRVVEAVHELDALPKLNTENTETKIVSLNEIFRSS